jgi:hypothetical protein
LAHRCAKKLVEATCERPADLLEQIPGTGRAVLVAMGLLAEDFSADDLRQAIPRMKDAAVTGGRLWQAEAGRPGPGHRPEPGGHHRG